MNRAFEHQAGPMPAEPSHHTNAKPHLVDISAGPQHTKPSNAFLLCRDDFSIVFASDLLQVLLQLPEQRAAGQRRDIFSLLGSSGVLDAVSVEAVLGPLRATGLRSASYELRTESGLHPITMRVKPSGESQWMLSFEDIHAEHESRAELLALTLTDPLVGTNNRRCYQQTVKSSLADNIPGTVMMLDLDHFKAVNDTLGHPVGDQLLRKVGERLRTMVGEDNLLARLGGDEFAVWCYTVNTEAMETMASRIVDRLNQPFLIEGQQIHIGASVGLAFATEAGTTYERMMRCADLALHEVKSSGRSGYRSFDLSIEVAAQNRRKQELELRKALASGQLQARYQARVNVETGELMGQQAAVYWQHPERGLLEPASFTGMASEIGLTAGISKWLLNTVCQEAAAFTCPQPISVSIADTQFSSRDNLVETVKHSLQTSGLAPDRLTLVVSEDALSHHEGRALKTLQDLRALGVRISMENAGTGDASLGKLIRFPFDHIRLAPLFAQEDSLDPQHRAIVNAIAVLGHSLGVTTSLDGIETQAQVNRLRAGGAAALVGYRLEPGLPAADVATVPAHS